MDFVQTRPPFLKLTQDGQSHLMRQLWTLFFKMDKVHGLVWTLSILLNIDRMRPCLDLAHLIPERNGQSPDKATIFQDGQGPDAALSGFCPFYSLSGPCPS